VGARPCRRSQNIPVGVFAGYKFEGGGGDTLSVNELTQIYIKLY
jgi:hypothetical protein